MFAASVVVVGGVPTELVLVVEPGARRVVVVPALVVEADVEAGDVVAGFVAVVGVEPASAMVVGTTGASVVAGGDRVVVVTTVVTAGGR